jgi:putative transposase
LNGRTGTPFNDLEDLTDAVCLVVRWRDRYTLSLPDLAEMFLQRGVVLTHEAVRAWEITLRPCLTETLRRKRRGIIGHSWYVDETYLKVQGRWHYLDRAIDTDGSLVDVRLSETRDLAAAEACFRSAWTVTGAKPDRLTTDGHSAYPQAIRTIFGEQVTHRTKRYFNNHLEQDHRGIKRRYWPTCGFKSFGGAGRFYRLFDEIRAFLRPQSRHHQTLSLPQCRAIHRERYTQLMALMGAA